MKQKLETLKIRMKEYGRVAIAYSGGVDSAFLLKVALDTLGAENVVAFIGDSESLPRKELTDAIVLAEQLGVTPVLVRSEEMNDTRYVENPPERCYYCKHELFSRLQDMAKEKGFPVVFDGNNSDDVGDWRPGQKAAREIGIVSPLMEVGMTKAEIRAISAELGLPTADKPASACLASRIPYGTPITSEALAMVEAAEEAVRSQGFRQLRVRHHGDLARIEVEPGSIERLLDVSTREALVTALKKIGYRFVTLDLQGYRMGSFNETLKV